MDEQQINRLSHDLGRIDSNTRDRVVLGQNELTLSAAAQAPSMPSGVSISDVYAIEFRVKKTGAPADSTNIARFTMASGDTPTTTHGMYVGDGDYYTVTNKTNTSNFKIISADGLFHVVNLIYYGS